MFEAWLSDLLASYLGHFLDIKPEALRVSLWKGESRGREGETRERVRSPLLACARPPPPRLNPLTTHTHTHTHIHARAPSETQPGPRASSWRMSA